MFFLVGALAVLVALLIVEHGNVKQLSNVVSRDREKNGHYVSYIRRSAGIAFRKEEENILDEMDYLLDSASVVIYVPDGACSACMNSLLLELRERKQLETTVVLGSAGNLLLRDAVISDSIRYYPIGGNEFQVPWIMMLYKYQGYYPICIKFESGDELLLDGILGESE